MLSNYEKGVKLPSVTTLKELTSIYQTTSDFILFGNNPNKERYLRYGDLISALETIKRTLDDTFKMELIPDSNKHPSYLSINIDDAELCLFYSKLFAFKKIKNVVGDDMYYQNGDMLPLLRRYIALK